jgi:hypothetical protein
MGVVTVTSRRPCYHNETPIDAHQASPRSRHSALLPSARSDLGGELHQDVGKPTGSDAVGLAILSSGSARIMRLLEDERERVGFTSKRSRGWGDQREGYGQIRFPCRFPAGALAGKQFTLPGEPVGLSGYAYPIVSKRLLGK